MKMEHRQFEKSVLVSMPWRVNYAYRMKLNFFRFPGERWVFEHAGNFSGIEVFMDELPNESQWKDFLQMLIEYCVNKGSIVLEISDGPIPSNWEFIQAFEEEFGMTPIIPESRKHEFKLALAKSGGIPILAQGSISLARPNPSIE